MKFIIFTTILFLSGCGNGQNTNLSEMTVSKCGVTITYHQVNDYFIIDNGLDNPNLQHFCHTGSWRGGFTSKAEPTCGFWATQTSTGLTLSTLDDQELTLNGSDTICQ